MLIIKHLITKQICESLKNNNRTQFHILAIGTTSKRLLLITKKFNVYDVSINSLDHAHDELYLPTKPITLIEKYPILYENQMFTQMRKMTKISNALIINDGKSDWFFFTKLEYKVHYNIDASEVFTKSDQSDEKNEVIVSSDKPRHYYSIVNMNNNLYMNIDRYDKDRDFSNMSIIPSKGRRYLICSNRQNTAIRMEKEIKCRSGIRVQWPIIKGFVTGNKFYLFGRSYIYIFDEDVYNNQGKEYPVHKISYDSYFICQDDKIPTEKNRQQRKDINSKFAIKFEI